MSRLPAVAGLAKAVHPALAWYGPYLLRLLLALACLSFGRLVFAWSNPNLFEGWEAAPFWFGLHFDLAALAFWFLPFHLLSLPPWAGLRRPGFQIAAKVCFHFCNGSALLLNLIDAGYYSFSGRRSAWDTLQFFMSDADVGTLWLQYLLGWWYLALLGVLVLVLTEWLYRRANRFEVPAPGLLGRAVVCLVLGGLLALSTRSERPTHPLSFVHAGQHVPQRLMPVVLNTPFVVARSLRNEPVLIRTYFSETELARRFDPVREFAPDTTRSPRNVVIIVVESLSSEFVGAYHLGQGFTPFLDSLIERSTVCLDSYACGRQSIEVGPAVVAGLPNLMRTMFLRSAYAASQLTSLPRLLQPLGFRSMFFHGARNGSMRYDVFAQLAGFNDYVGLNEYPNPADHDGSWGILDEPFLQFMARRLADTPQPFFAYVHTLTSHHPFKVPAGFEGKFPKGSHPICETIGYTDFALRRFFETAQQMPWFSNTLFFITADHTAKFTHPHAASPLQVFQVPIVLFDPASPVHREIREPVCHADILPTVLNLLGWRGRAICFGRDFLGDGRGYVVLFHNNLYHAVERDWVLSYDGQRLAAFHPRVDGRLVTVPPTQTPTAAKTLAERQERLQAFLQAFTTRLVRNQLVLPLQSSDVSGSGTVNSGLSK